MKLSKYIFTVVLIAFMAACSTTSKLDRSQAPEPGLAPQINLGSYDTYTMANGLKVIVVENHKLPRVSYSLTVDRDPIFEGDKAGYVSMAGSLLGNGTMTRGKAEIDEQVDFIGASFSTSSTGMYGSSLKKHSEALLNIMSDVLLHPEFPESELEKEKKQTLSGLASETTNANSISGNITKASCFGLDHPYGEQQTEETTNNITRDDLVNYYQTYFKPNISYLVVLGDITLEEAKEQTEKYFGKWRKFDVPNGNIEMPVQPSANQVVFAPLQGAVQSVIEITYPVDLKPGSDDAIAASVMNSILGGGVFSGRLMQNLREDKAYTYGARSSLGSDEFVGQFSAYASVRNEVTDSSITEFMYELNRLATELVPDSTLQFVKNSMNGSFARSLERPQTIGRFALNTEKYSLPKDYYSNYLSKLAAVTSEDVLAMAKKYIKPENAYITVVGNKDVSDNLKQFSADGNIKFVGLYGQPWVDMKPIPEGITAELVLQNYITAIGGEEKLGEVNSYKQSGQMLMGPMALDVEVLKKNDKYKMSVLMQGNPMSVQTYDGKEGSVSQMGTVTKMTEEELEGVKHEGDLLVELKYGEIGYQTTLLGIETIDDEEAYAMELIDATGSASTVYYSIATGLKIKSMSSQDVEGASIIISSRILDYLEVDGIKFASKIEQSMGDRTMVMEMNNVELNPKIKDSEFKVD